MLNRRRFLQTTSTVAFTGGSLLALRSGLGGPAAVGRKSPSALIAGKSDELLVHTAEPLVFESPLSLLDQQVLTPKSQLFVRSNANPVGMSTTAPADVKDWTIELTGLAEGARTMNLAALAGLPQVEVELVLQCSGNGRSMFSRAAKTEGTQWGRGGIGNVRFGGPKLIEVLRHLKVEPAPTAQYVAAEGFDAPAPGKNDFEHSIPLGDVLDRAFLATTMNGEPLPAIHGGPVRLVTPGYYGTVQLKWLSRLRFEAEESANPYHADLYRTPNRRLSPGEKFRFDRSNSTPTWTMKLASLITSHSDGQQVGTEPTKVSGYSWNDGSAPLQSVLLSLDLGQTWSRVPVTLSKSPYAWSRWSAPVTLQSGRNTVWITAVDALGRTQPDDGAIAWNPAGYEWNGVEKLVLNVG